MHDFPRVPLAAPDQRQARPQGYAIAEANDGTVDRPTDASFDQRNRIGARRPRHLVLGAIEEVAHVMNAQPSAEY
jgi:hypothetical protein